MANVVEKISPEVLDIAFVGIQKDVCKDSFYEFLKEAFKLLHPGEEIEDNWHIQVICDKLQARAELLLKKKPGKNLIINIPPRSLKSIMVTVAFPAWLWIRDERLKIIASSYSATLSTEHCVMTRRIIESRWYQRRWGKKVNMAPDQNQKTFFENTRSGFRRSTSTGGTITGSGGDVVIVDDPTNPTQAVSDADRKTANDHFDKTLSTRLNNPSLGFFVIVMQRLHEDDLTGHVMRENPERWERICIPAMESKIVAPEWLHEKYTDGLFFPERFTRAILDNFLKVLGSYGYSGQYGQNPAPEEGGIWQKYFIPIEDADFPVRKTLLNYGTDWDLAYTKDQLNSASAYVTSGMSDGRMYIDDIGWGFYEFPDLIKFMSRKPSPHYIEAMASGRSAKQTLAGRGIPAIEVEVSGGDKIARARNATPHAEAGFVYCRKSLLDRIYFDENQGILKFPNGTHDDLADVLAQAVQRHFNESLDQEDSYVYDEPVKISTI
jgi:predicted phage terminase large subunit-like protein